MPSTFPPGVLARLREEHEVRIQTRAAADAPLHSTIIWVVVDRQDRVLVRSWRGASARWYREARANPQVGLRMGDEVLEASAEPATDPDRLEACSDGFLRKYAGAGETPAMVADEILDTTLELRPR